MIEKPKKGRLMYDVINNKIKRLMKKIFIINQEINKYTNSQNCKPQISKNRKLKKDRTLFIIVLL